MAKNNMVMVGAGKIADIFGLEFNSLSLSDKVAATMRHIINATYRIDDDCMIISNNGAVFYDRVVANNRREKIQWMKQRAIMMKQLGDYDEIIFACESWAGPPGSTSEPSKHPERKEFFFVVGINKTEQHMCMVPVSEFNYKDVILEVNMTERGDDMLVLDQLLTSAAFDALKAKRDHFQAICVRDSGLPPDQVDLMLSIVALKQANDLSFNDAVNRIRKSVLKKLGIKKKDAEKIYASFLEKIGNSEEIQTILGVAPRP